MSYDVSFWSGARAPGSEVLDALEEGEYDVVAPSPALPLLRRELLRRWPELDDVLETAPEEPDADGTLRCLTLTLPFARLDLLPAVLDVARAHGLEAYDPQADGDDHGCGTCGEGAPAPDLGAAWTAGSFSPELGIGPRWIARAWQLSGLPPAVGFGEAVGVFVLAMVLRDGASVPADVARSRVASVARACAAGVPAQEVWAEIDFVTVDVQGYARAVAAGGY